MLFIHSSTDGYLDCFYLLALVTNAAMYMAVRVSLSPCFQFFCVCVPRSGTAGSRGIFNIKGFIWAEVLVGFVEVWGKCHTPVL